MLDPLRLFKLPVMKRIIRLATVTMMLMIAALSCHEALAATQDEIIDAFWNDKAVQAEIERIKHRLKPNHEEIQIVGLGEGCGVAGCSFTNLVVLKLRRAGVNPQAGSVLVTVTDRNGKIGKVTLMELRPRGMPDLKIENSIPPPEPELKIERRLSPPNPETEQLQ